MPTQSIQERIHSVFQRLTRQPIYADPLATFCGYLQRLLTTIAIAVIYCGYLSWPFIAAIYRDLEIKGI